MLLFKPFDIFFTDLSFSNNTEINSGEELINLVKKTAPNLRIGIITMHAKTNRIFNVIKNQQPLAYILKGTCNENELNSAIQKMLKNEIEKVEKINKVEKEFSDKIMSVTEIATKEHDDRVKIVNDELNDNSEKVKKEFDERIKENKVGTNEDLANKIGDTFDVNVVLPEEKDEE